MSTVRILALPSSAADALIVQIPSLAKYDLGPCSFRGVVRVMEALAEDEGAESS